MILTNTNFNSPELIELYETYPRFVVTLEDTREKVEYIGRSGPIPSDSWKELSQFVSNNPNYKIRGMMIGFRDNMISFPIDADGYFFRCSIIATYDWEKHSFIAGILKNGILELDKYELPEMIHLGHEQRSIDGCGYSLIRNTQICQQNS